MDEVQPSGVALPETAPEGQRACAAPPVVGIGASAGGLEVFKLLLSVLPADTGYAIVFVQHLDPSHHSMLADILRRSTAMPVREAADGIPLEANHVYVIPANAEMTMAGSALALTVRTEAAGTHMPIDHFLRSLAAECGSGAVGVILSGTGSDGAAGVEAVKAAGGVTFAQDPATAKFGAMPQAAAATGCVDFVLPPEGIAAELARIAQHPYLADPAGMQEAETPAADAELFASILATVHEATGVDFSLYREKMIRRRILRRLALRNIGSLADYAERIASDSAELMALERDLLIGVTSFFRDRESFECLKRVVFPRLIQGRPAGETLRVWVAGCATGEEAFSIAILLQEFLSETGTAFPVQIFASDLNAAAIERARTGRFPEKIAADLTPQRLNRCFAKIEGGYQINKSLREMCVFTRHNLIDDPPFSRLDLISCRNVLIYMGAVQRDILPLFHYALKRGGFLMLGASEGAAADELFSVADREHRIYARRETARRPRAFTPAAPHKPAPVPAAESRGGPDIRKEVDRILLSKYSPAGVVVDENLEIVEIRGNAGPYLALPAGKVSYNLMKLIPDTGLLLEVEKLIRRARETGEPARQERVALAREGSAAALHVEAVPLDASGSGAVLVLFEPARLAETAPAAQPDAPGEGDPRDRRIAMLDRQLTDAKERFLSALQEHQTSREESLNVTEEALSANEELQSLNEELETAK